MNIYRTDRLNENGGLIFYYQLIPFALIELNHQKSKSTNSLSENFAVFTSVDCNTLKRIERLFVK